MREGVERHGSGGWDRRLVIHGLKTYHVLEREVGWSVRRARFSEDGRFLAVAAWTPAVPEGPSDPSAMLFELTYR